MERAPTPRDTATLGESETVRKQNSVDELMQVNNMLDKEFRLPVTATRNGTWVHSAFHNVTAMIGAGVLGLPWAIAYLGWVGGMVVMVLSWVISLYTLHQLVALHELDGKRFNRYHELGQYTFGKKWGDIIIVTPQLIVMVGLGITYTVTGGKALYRFWGLVCPKQYNMPEVYPNGHCTTAFGLSAWIVMYAIIQLFLIQCPDFNALSAVSLMAAAMSITYSTIGIGASLHAGKQPNVQYNLDGHSMADGIFGICNAFGIVAFAYGGHNVVLEIQATMPSPPATYKPYMRGVYVAYAILSWCYFGVGFVGYYIYGNEVKDNLLFSIGGPPWLMCIAHMAVFIHVCGSYQVYTMPVLDMIEMQMVKHRISNNFIMRLVYRSVYVCFTTFTAVTIPFFGDLMGFIGALGMGPASFWIPPMIWLVLKKPNRGDWNFWASWVCIVLGVLVTVVGATGGLRGIIIDASGYKFYQ